MKDLQFQIAELPFGLNRLLRMHWRVRNNERDAWRLKVRAALGRNVPEFPGRVMIEYTAYRVKLQDKDNNTSSFKMIGDALVFYNIIRDDSPKYIDEDKSRYRQEKVAHFADQRIEVTIKDLEVAS